jgi:hypothetical protein
VLGAVCAAVGCDGTVVTLGEAPRRAPEAGAPNGGAANAGTANRGASGGGAGEGGSVVDLPLLPRFPSIRKLDELASDGENDNPTLTSDLLEIYFTSDREGGLGGGDVWRAARARATDTFDEPELVGALSTDAYESSSAVSLDGRWLWVGSERDGGQGELDVWVSERAARDGEWSEARVVPELSSPEKDIPRPPGFGGVIMPLGSQRDSPGTYRTFFARFTGSGFEAPEAIPELVLTDGSTVDGFLSSDGRSFFFALSLGDDESDLYVARRARTDQSFEEPEPLDDLNTDGDERDPWMSPDGTRFFFASDRGGALAIYEATVSY